jgi:chromosome segregation ATPase
VQPLTGAPQAKDGKFTFTGLMPGATTPIQMQHKILAQHQQQALSQGAPPAKPTALNADSTNEMLRLKAQVVQLTEKLTQANANLATTSESVVRGNKALTTERAQFHAKYASLTKKLEVMQAALAEAEALPKEAVTNAKLLNAKVLELQTENEKLAATHAELEASLAKAEAAAAATAQALLLEAEPMMVEPTAEPTAEATIEEKEAPAAVSNEVALAMAELQEKFTNLSAQHSTLLSKQFELEQSLENKGAELAAAEEELGAAIERAEEAEAEVAELTLQVESAQREIAQTDSLIDTLDEKLADARSEAPTEAAAAPTEVPTEAAAAAEADCACCPATARCEEMEREASAARDMTDGASAHEYKQLHEEWKFLDGLARRARHALKTGEPERVMVAHMYTGSASDGDGAAASEARFDLSEHIGVHPRPMGKPIDDCCLHCAVDTGAAAAERDTATAEGRTTAFVQAVSKDLKFSMDGSQALYASSSTTGVALRV